MHRSCRRYFVTQKSTKHPMDKPQLEQQLKQLILRECDKEDDFDWQEIDTQELLFGQDSRIQMDSLDALQVSLALQQHHGVRIEGAKEGRQVLTTIANIAAFIRQHA